MDPTQATENTEGPLFKNKIIGNKEPLMLPTTNRHMQSYTKKKY